MKDAKSIISHLVQRPYMKKCAQMHCFEVLLGLLPNSFTRMVHFVYIKNETLFFVLNHPSAKMEFHYKRSLIKSLLSRIIQYHPECTVLNVQKVECFVTHQTDEKAPTQPTMAFLGYIERASGDFANQAIDASLYDLFEQIRQTLHTSSKCS